MKLDEITRAVLPPAIHNGLERWLIQLREQAGRQLVSVVLYGGVAHGEYSPRGSDINLLVVVKEITLELLDQMAPLLQQGARELRLAVLAKAGLDTAPLRQVLALKRGELKLNAAGLKLLYGAFMSAVQHAAQWVETI